MTATGTQLSHILKELENIHYPNGIQSQRIQRLKAVQNQENNELIAIYNLVQSHSLGLRNKAVLRYEKLLSTELGSVGKMPLVSTKDKIALKCSTEQIEENVQTMLQQIEEMPKEWTLIHLTPQYNPLDNINEDNNTYETNGIHIAVFNCGQQEEHPFLVNVDAPKDLVNGSPVQIVQEMMSIISGNKEALMSHKEKTFRNAKEKLSYMNRTQSIEDRLMAIIRDIQDMWLKEWRCLLSGKYIDTTLEEKIKSGITNFFKTEHADLEITTRTISLLTYVVKAVNKLKLMEIKRAVYYCFPQISDKSLLRDIVLFVKKLSDDVLQEADTKKHPVILILEDSLDCFPWEMINILEDEPVSRVPSLQFIYTLFKEHEKDIVDGHKILTSYDKGTYIVNPDMDLKSMEVRMMHFFNYWTPKWTGISGYHPNGEDFFELITSSEIFSYNGHGSGSHLLSMDKIQRTHVKAVVFLFGCASTKINRMDPQIEMYGPYHMYLIARCPCVVGMLWEVTDFDTDVLATNFMSQWIPSEAPVHWKYVDKSKWYKAEHTIKFVSDKKSSSEEINCEPDLLRALNLSKKSVSYFRTKSACVARGLPVRIQMK